MAIVGASARAAAESAVRAGFDVATADRFADQDLCRIAAATRMDEYPDGLADWLRRLSPRPAAWLYTGALENRPELVDAMAAECSLWGNRGDVLRQVRSVPQLADALRRAGLRFPDTRASPDGLPRDGTWLAKSGRGGGGSGVRRLGGPLAPHAVYQRYVPGIPCSAVFVAAKGAAVLVGVVRQLVGEDWLGAHEFQYCGALGPWPVDDRLRDEIARIGSVVAARFGLVGLFGVDFVLDANRVWTIEVNPRYPASVEVLERATSIRAIAAHAIACRDHRLPPIQADWDQKCHGKAIVFAKRRIVLTPENPVSSGAFAPGMLADLPHAATVIEAGQPVLTVFAADADADRVTRLLQIRVAEVEASLYP